MIASTMLASLFAPVCPSFAVASASSSAADFILSCCIPALFPLAALIVSYLLLAFTSAKPRASVEPVAKDVVPKSLSTSLSSSAVHDRSISAIADTIDHCDSLNATLKPEDNHQAPVPLPLLLIKSPAVSDSLSIQAKSIVLNIDSEDFKPQTAIHRSKQAFEYYLRWDLPDDELEQLSYAEKARRFYILKSYSSSPNDKAKTIQLHEHANALKDPKDLDNLGPRQTIDQHMFPVATEQALLEHPSEPPEQLSLVLYGQYNQLPRSRNQDKALDCNQLNINPFPILTSKKLELFSSANDVNLSEFDRMQARARRAVFLLSLIP